MASKLVPVCGTGVLLFSAFMLVILPTPCRSFCEPEELNVTISSIADFIEENQDKLSDCCSNNTQGLCQAKGGFCVPSWLGHHCQRNDPRLCGYGGCTCCLPQECSGSCSSGARKGVCRSTCNSNEDAVSGKCSSGNCVCCVRKIVITPRYYPSCEEFCSSNEEICIPKRMCLRYDLIQTFEQFLDESDWCATGNCICCPWYLVMPWK